jgi:uncharacterized membrane-anchored protein YitT (DUF2179 family)
MKQIFKHILYAIAFILLLVVNIPVWLFWFLPMYKKGTFESVKWDWDGWCIHWDVSNDSEFYKTSMEGWWGFVIGCNIVYVDYFPKLALDKQHITHEKTHVLQNYIFNILFYPLYILMSLGIYLFGGKNRNAYYDNPFEIWARYKAGQMIYIPRALWTKRSNDRWPWS